MGAFKKVLIVGAGPSGLLLALLLSKHGIAVEIFEASHELDRQPRAAIYGPAAVPDLRRAGILDEVRKRGLSPTSITWRRLPDYDIITRFDMSVLADYDPSSLSGFGLGSGGNQDLRSAGLVLDELDELMLREFVHTYGGVVHWQHRVVGTGQDGTKAWVDVSPPEEEGTTKRFHGDYVVGCDGATSQVRKSLFGNEFPGMTFPRPIVATNVYYDFAKFGFTDSDLIIDPDNFFIAVHLNHKGMYRVTYGEEPGLSWDEMKARQPAKFQAMLPGHPMPGDYELVSMSPYHMHQRCSPSFRSGRILLAADAAHVCNPWGGLGITGGFVDVGGLYDCLAGIYDGKADDDILDLYSEKRIEKWKTVIDPVSQGNFMRVCDSSPATISERDAFMVACEQARSDISLQREMIKALFDVRYDFTQHYKA
ncbi:FAD binding domain-containing protein [Xylariaceae sp. FL0255]|nr:FAD binding domain-containing protein [Xylariaceae sp. FL0255]